MRSANGSSTGQALLILDARSEGRVWPRADDALADLESRFGRSRRICVAQAALGGCRGCFQCWTKTPGQCRMADDFDGIGRALLASDAVCVVSELTCGGWSSTAKRLLDRFIPLILPQFSVLCGETHHKPRYARYPRLMALGLGRGGPDAVEQAIFRTLVGRNAVNMHAPGHAAAVLGEDATEDQARLGVETLLACADPRPFGAELDELLRLAGVGRTHAPLPDAAPGRALLLIGSPKPGGGTSALLGNQLFKALAGWSAEALRLGPGLETPDGRRRLQDAARQADLLVLASPLYVDSLPYPVTLALEALRTPEPEGQGGRRRFAAIINSGFPEAAQNSVALAILRRLAEESGMDWAGGLALGGGEALTGDQPLDALGRRPPVVHVLKALELAGTALAAGRPIPAECAGLMDRSPIPLLPAGAWRWFYRLAGNRMWNGRARAHGLDPARMAQRPYAP